MSLVEPCVPDSVYFKYKSIERRKKELSARERVLKEQRETSLNGKLRSLNETRKREFCSLSSAHQKLIVDFAEKKTSTVICQSRLPQREDNSIINFLHINVFCHLNRKFIKFREKISADAKRPIFSSFIPIQIFSINDKFGNIDGSSFVFFVGTRQFYLGESHI